jgi:hypothetical protein
MQRSGFQFYFMQDAFHYLNCTSPPLLKIKLGEARGTEKGPQVPTRFADILIFSLINTPRCAT